MTGVKEGAASNYERGGDNMAIESLGLLSPGSHKGGHELNSDQAIANLGQWSDRERGVRRDFVAGFVHGAMATSRACFAPAVVAWGLLAAIGCLLVDATNSLLNQQSVEGD